MGIAGGNFDISHEEDSTRRQWEGGYVGCVDQVGLLSLGDAVTKV